MSVLDVKNLSVSYERPKNVKVSKSEKGGEKYLTVVDNVSFSVEKGEIFGIVGESGSGKTTLSKGILHLEKNIEGDILLNGESIRSKSHKEISKEIQMIFQNPLASFNPHHTMEYSLKEVARIHKIPKQEYHQRLRELMNAASLTEAMSRRYPSQLSGGQLQRFAIIRALLLQPKILIADEAVSALDISIQTNILDLLLHFRKKLGITIIFITHDLNVVKDICDRVAVMYLGSILELADRNTFFDQPLHPYTKLLLDSRVRTDPDERRAEDYVFEDVPSVFDIPAGCKFSTRCGEFWEEVCSTSAPELFSFTHTHCAACHRLHI